MRSREVSVRAGTDAKAGGDAWESVVERHLDRALDLGILGHWVHNQARTRVVGGKLIYERPGVADYSGHIVSGIAVALECKSTRADRLLKSAVEPLQAAHLDVLARDGGLALLLAEMRPRAGEVHRFAIPWQEVPWRRARTADALWLEDAVGRLEWAFPSGLGACFLERYLAPALRRPPARSRKVYPRE